jgi:monothiol glutaredoxin
MEAILTQIKNDIENNDVVLYMKGTASSPMCGFSGAVVKVLQALNIPFKDINVLENNELREAIKIYSEWPTIPQLYVKQQFIGGCDIVREMYKSGELQQLLKDNGLLLAQD